MIQILNKILKKQCLFFVVGLAIALIWLGSPFWTRTGLAINHQPQEGLALSEQTGQTGQTGYAHGLALLEHGQQAFDAGRMEAALDAWQQALDTLGTDDPILRGVVFNHMAIAHQRLGQWTAADTAIQSGLALTETNSGQQQPKGHILIRAQLLNTQGRLEWSIGQVDAALKTWQRATALYEAIDDTTGVVGSQINQVQALESLGYYRQACDRLLEVLAIDQNRGQTTRQTCQQLGVSQTAEKEAALKHIFQTIDTQPNPQLKHLGLRSLGNVLRLTGQLDLSHQVLLHALEPTETMASMPSVIEPIQGTDQDSNQISEQEALTLLSLAATETAQYQRAKTLYNRTKLSGDRALAAQFVADAIDRYDQVATASIVLNGSLDGSSSAPLPSSFTGLQAQLQRLTLLIDLTDWNQRVQHVNALNPFVPPDSFSRPNWPAIEPLVTALLEQLPPRSPELTIDIPNARVSGSTANASPTAYPVSRQTIDAYLALTQHLIRLPDLLLQSQAQPQTNWLAIAQQLATTAVTQADQLADVRSQSYAYGILGHIYEVQATPLNPSLVRGKTTLAQAQASTLNALGLAQSAQIADITYRWQWQLGRLAEKQQREEEAIAYYEAAVKTLDTVRNNLLNIDADVQFSFRDDVEPIYRRLVELLLAQNNGQPSQATLRRAIHDIDALQLSELENFLGCNLAESVALSETLVDPTAVVVYPIILQHQLAVITKWPHTDELHLHTVSINETALKVKLTAFRRELSRPFRTNTGLRLSQELYTWLLRPVESLLDDAQAETLVFVLDGKFRNVPMATLHDGQQYVVQRYALALMPGLQLLKPQPIAQNELDVLTFGLSQMRKEFPPHRGFDDLNNVEVEIKEIKNQLPSRLFLNQDFTQTTLADQIEAVTAPIVHLATHGQFSSEPTDTFVLAWDQRIDVNTLSDILQTRNAEANPIELLVLSACKTAEGDDRAALGLAGIAVRSGARSTLASLWTVDDKATADMMSQFYQELGQVGSSSAEPIAKAEALRRAQVKLLTSEQFNAPRYWAPFILVGNWL